MTAEIDTTKQAGFPQPEPPEEFISLSEIARMILRHRWKIVVFVLLVTTASAVLFISSPRQYKAEGFLQVIPPTSAIDEKVDQASFETIINSHLQTIQSAFIAEEVAAAIDTGDVRITSLALSRAVKIIRPPKSNLIVLTAGMPSPDQAIAVVKTWIKKYLASMRKNNVNVALSQIRSLLKKAQSGIMEIQAKADQMKTRADQTKPLVDLARGIDDNQLWRELGDNAPAEKLKNLSQIHIKGQEQSKEYLTVKTMLYGVDQALAAALANRSFLQDVESYLEYKVRLLENHSAIPEPAPLSSNAVQFAETMLKTTDVIEVGEPALKGSERGALRKTAVVFFTSLCLALFCAYLAEWFKTIKT
ncbi:MAG: Wzz/FepE/Etk N-terminal domain-containing protein [Kiritimatiellia bacterium]|nr:Wzz/FepE/Etk N-terminal domain-containing protein [Kiritimatiellia bacterium]